MYNLEAVSLAILLVLLVLWLRTYLLLRKYEPPVSYTIERVSILF